ncbi:MAG: helix-turn-helix domain-containing protein [Rhizobiaceae bacterium]|nr:helix-turn-helix domain-containing protein [Rhizobiaceae bacterium]
MTGSVPRFFVYGEPDRPLDVGFIHVERVMARKPLHLGTVEAHKHDHLSQITYWTQGRGHYFYEDRSLDFFAPAISFMPSGVVHGFKVEPERSDAIVVSIADDALLAIQAQTILPLDAPVMVPDAPDNPLWSGLDAVMHRIEAEYGDGRPGMDRTLAALAGVVLTDIARLAHEGPARSAPTGAAALAREFRRLVDRHFRENWPIDRYEKELGTTAHLLAKTCRGTFGVSPKEFIGDRRMLEAKRLLLFTVRPVEDVAYELGFRDAAYFSRFFKERIGEPPGVWRGRQAR